jgi:anthraniloyl-CoA monooxygenase
LEGARFPRFFPGWHQHYHIYSPITALNGAVEVARAFTEEGADLIDVLAGKTEADCKPIYDRMFQTPFADKIRNEARVSTMAVGNIFEADHANSILVAGRADLVALACPHLIDPMWTLRAAAA